MDFLKVKSVTFYQAVLLGARQQNTVNPTVSQAEKIQAVFCDDKVFLRDTTTQKDNMKDKVVIVGLHNVRDLRVSTEDFLKSEYAEIFSCWNEDGADVVVSPAGNPDHIPGTLPEIEDVRAELDALGVKYDKRWGVQRLIEAKDEYLNK